MESSWSLLLLSSSTVGLVRRKDMSFLKFTLKKKACFGRDRTNQPVAVAESSTVGVGVSEKVSKSVGDEDSLLSLTDNDDITELQ